MTTPKKGQKVRVLEITQPDISYLTAGKEYEVTATSGADNSFSVTADSGVSIYCLHPHCAHATWEIVND